MTRTEVGNYDPKCPTEETVGIVVEDGSKDDLEFAVMVNRGANGNPVKKPLVPIL